MKSKFTEHEVHIAGLVGAIFGFISGAGLMALIAIIF
jgi:tetrahydromethanopterin S-methyltransferase subunit B